jgi:hypothetical protein
LELVGGSLEFNLSNLTGGEHSIGGGVLVMGECYHVAATWDGATMRLFINGEETTSGPFQGPVHYDDNPVLIGADDDGGGVPGNAFFLGQIDEVRISEGALSPEDFLVPTAAQPTPPSPAVMYPATPNPFNPITTIGFEVGTNQLVTVGVYDVRGALVRVLLDAAEVPPGHHEVIWDGRDARNVRVGSGVYFVRMVAPGFRQTQRLALVK